MKYSGVFLKNADTNEERILRAFAHWGLKRQKSAMNDSSGNGFSPPIKTQANVPKPSQSTPPSDAQTFVIGVGSEVLGDVIKKTPIARPLYAPLRYVDPLSHVTNIFGDPMSNEEVPTALGANAGVDIAKSFGIFDWVEPAKDKAVQKVSPYISLPLKQRIAAILAHPSMRAATTVAGHLDHIAGPISYGYLGGRLASDPLNAYAEYLDQKSSNNQVSEQDRMRLNSKILTDWERNGRANTSEYDELRQKTIHQYLQNRPLLGKPLKGYTRTFGQFNTGAVSEPASPNVWNNLPSIYRKYYDPRDDFGKKPSDK
jgi:hypothetical protein